MSQLKSLKDLSKIKGKTVFLRVDFNVPISGGRVSDTTKIEKLKININSLLNEKCKVILASHLGRPQKKGRDGLSLKPVKKISEKILGHEINFLDINDALTKASKTYLKNVLGVETMPLVSSDFNHDSRSSIVDAGLTKVISDNFATVFSWYDNEWGFSNRMIDVALTLKNKL